jgi:uncharacterized protein YacL
MTLLFIRTFFLIISTLVGFYVGAVSLYPFLGVCFGFGTGLALILLEVSLRRVSVRGLSSMVFGLLLGVFMAKLVSDILSLLPLGDFVQSVSRVVFTLVFSYLGAVMALRGKDEFNLIIPYVRFKRQDMEERIVLLDTSAIIDGRIRDIYKTNFFAGRIVVPRFVLQELQRVADSDDPLKRQKGRRGLEFLRNIQKDAAFDLRIHEEEFPHEEDVDAKLVRLAKMIDARICTTDFNLSRAAAIQGVQTLNLHELVNALKPMFFVGDELPVRLVREGKEPDQAVAYTEEGVMVVVGDARNLIGKTVMIQVSSVLQTQSGRMVFAKLVNRAEGKQKSA